MCPDHGPNETHPCTNNGLLDHRLKTRIYLASKYIFEKKCKENMLIISQMMKLEMTGQINLKENHATNKAAMVKSPAHDEGRRYPTTSHGWRTQVSHDKP